MLCGGLQMGARFCMAHLMTHKSETLGFPSMALDLTSTQTSYPLLIPR